ncbi:DUF4935 domain-containing protein [Ochrobactrum sp. S46]|nr:DUF4935 domain-containing protein [Ochrobactrum sp. S45]MBK0042441.1 DUF4935 domain-containing protein [Ochrobactrum sp. S46]
MSDTNKSSNKSDAAANEKSSSNGQFSDEIWYLEDVFPDTNQILSWENTISASSSDTIIAFDTNVLMLPYTVGNQELPEIRAVYKRLIKDNRLFIPARVIREFVKNRDTKIAEFEKSISDKASSFLNTPAFEIPGVLDGLPEKKAVDSALKQLKDSKLSLRKAVNSLTGVIRAWRGNDPVSQIYYELFKSNVIVEVGGDRLAIEAEWKSRQKQKRPPGYKDASKLDTGIGDYIIWKTLLNIGASKKKHLIFVTGDQKADWFVRTDGKGLFPRPELVAEYKNASGGMHLKLSNLADIFEDLTSSSDLVNEVREAEDAARVLSRVRKAVDSYRLRPRFSNKQTRLDFNEEDRNSDYTVNRITTISEFDIAQIRDKGHSVLLFLNIEDESLKISAQPGYRISYVIAFSGQEIEEEDLEFEDVFVSVNRGSTIVLRNDVGLTFTCEVMGLNLDSENKKADVIMKVRMTSLGEPIICP